jgi:hypothetical protein
MNKMENLSRKESNTLKGFFILLIIIGHNHILCPVNGMGMSYLYRFHVIAFFILPFFYVNYQGKLNIKNIREYFVRNYMPYLLFYSFSFLLFHLVIERDGIDIALFLKGILSGSQPVLKQTAGFYFLWFLPAFFAVTLVRMVFDNVNRLFKVLIILLSVFLHLFLSWNAREELFNSIPFALSQGFFYFAYGLIAFNLLNFLPSLKYVGAFVFIVISVVFFMGHEINIPFLFPVGFVMFSLSVVKWLKYIPFMDKLGNYSLPIYLIHVYIYNGFEHLFPYTIVFGIVNLVLTILMSFFVSTILLNINFLRKLIFPRDWNELVTFYHK